MKKLLMIAVAISLGACATPRAYNRIDADARPMIQKLESIVIVSQSEIGTEIEISDMTSAAGGGLIWAIADANVNAARTKKAEELIVPIRDKMLDFDFAAKIESDLESALANTGMEGATDVYLMRGMEKDTKSKMTGASDANAIMFINTNYNLSSNFGEMVASAFVEVFPVTSDLFPYSEKPDSDAKLAEATDNIYRNNFRTSIALAAMADRDSNAEMVAETDGAELIDALSKASAMLAKQIAYDLMKDDSDEDE